MTNWKEVVPSVEDDSEMWDFDKNSVLIGAFKKKEVVGPKKSSLYTFDVDGKLYKVWGGVILNDRLSEAKENQEVKIEYLGEVRASSGNDYRDFKVYFAE